MDDAHGVVLAHSLKSLAHGVAELTKGSALRSALSAKDGAGESFGFRERDVDGWAVGVEDVDQTVFVSVKVLASINK